MANYFTAATELLADTSARALLLAALAAIVLRFGLSGNANFQHRAWTAVLCGMLLLPVLTQLTPGLSLLPSGWRWESRAVIAQSSAPPEETIPAEPRDAVHAAPSDKADEPVRATVPGDWVESPPAQSADLARGVSDRDQAADEARQAVFRRAMLRQATSPTIAVHIKRQRCRRDSRSIGPA